MELGKIQKLKILRMGPHGAFLEGDVLLPKKFLEEGDKAGDEVEVFILRDSEDRLVASRLLPKAEVGDFAILKVSETTRIGAFLDWGLDKDLFLPFREQSHSVQQGEEVFVYIYLDKTGRLAATMRVKNKFRTDPPYHENDWAEGMVYSVVPRLGAFILLDGHYNGMVTRKKMIYPLRQGQRAHFRVEGVKKDGKVDLSMQPRAYERMGKDADRIYQTLQANGGFLRVNDHSEPEDIRLLFGMSKAQFKRCVGRLLKAGKVEFQGDGLAIKGEGTDGRREKRR